MKTILRMAVLLWALSSLAVAASEDDSALMTIAEPLALQSDPTDSAASAARQMRAFAEAELGRHREAEAVFPFASRPAEPERAPTPPSHRAVAAADAVATLARERRIVLVNEAHHDARTRWLTLQLLPRLREIGYTHFAAEALDENDTDLAERGHPIPASGSRFLREPLYGEIIRQALRLGYVVVPYEYTGSDSDVQARETGQARNLMARVFESQPEAKLFVHAGFAHIDRRKGRLWDAAPMAMELARLSGHDPLSVDQTVLLSAGTDREAAWVGALLDGFAPTEPMALLNRDDDHVWSLDASLHDVSIVLPRNQAGPARPGWLTLAGQRRVWSLPTTDACGDVLPCLIQAHHADEGDDAIAAERMAITRAQTTVDLYLFPGRYRLTATGRTGRALSAMRIVTID